MIISKRKKIIYYTLLIIAALLVAAPLIFAVLLSFSENTDLLKGIYIPESINFSAYDKAFSLQPFGKYIFNSFVSSTIITVFQVSIGLLAAYAFAFLDFKGKDFLFAAFLATMMIPTEVLVVSNFQTIRSMELLNTFPGLVLPMLVSTFGIFLLRQNMMQIPKELKEASEIAGIGNFRFFVKIVIPLVKNSIITLGIYTFLTSWNAYMWPLRVTTDQTVRTVQIGLRQLSGVDAVNDYSMIAAGAIIVALPTLLIIFFGQSHLEEGLSEGAIK